MKIILTGGGTGGHFYPLIAVAQQIRKVAREERLLEPELIYMGPSEYDRDALFENNITFKHISAGKRRRYRSILNIFDLFKIAWGIGKAMVKVFLLFPDVVFSKGGYASVPVLFAARFFGIPVIIHESDSMPGRANAWAARFAKRIAISYPESDTEFEKIISSKKGHSPKIALTGNPIRHELETLASSGAREFLQLEEDTPVLLVLGGSQGAQTINDALIEALPELLERYIVVHQVGEKNLEIVKGTSQIILENNPHTDRYKPFGFLNVLGMRMAAGVADIIISRAGSSAIFEIAAWGKPSIIVPIPQDVSHDQEHNAFAYARSGAAIVIEQDNLTPHLIASEINRLMDNPEERKKMSEAAHAFARPDAAQKIAIEILELALEHEK